MELPIGVPLLLPRGIAIGHEYRLQAYGIPETFRTTPNATQVISGGQSVLTHAFLMGESEAAAVTVHNAMQLYLIDGTEADGASGVPRRFRLQLSLVVIHRPAFVAVAFVLAAELENGAILQAALQVKQ